MQLAGSSLLAYHDQSYSHREGFCTSRRSIMETDGIIIAVILFAILLAWYVLLETDERREKRKRKIGNRSAEFAQRTVEHENEHNHLENSSNR